MELSHYDFDIITFVKKYDIPPRLVPQVNRYKELMLKESPSPSEIEEINNLAIVLQPYNITAEDYNKLFQAIQNVQLFVKDDLLAYLNNLFSEYNTRMQTIETTFSNRMNEMNAQFDDTYNEGVAKLTEIEAWYAGVKNNIATIQTFYFQNWAELSFCQYKEYPKNAEGKYIITITTNVGDSLIARQTEWQENINGTDYYWLKQEVFDLDGVTIIKEKTKREYKNTDGIYISEVI